MEKLMTLLVTLFQNISMDAEKWTAAFEKFLREENPWEAVKQPSPKVWKTIKLGTHKTLDDLIGAIRVTGAKISSWAKEPFHGVTLAPNETEIDLVIPSVAELGYGVGASYNQICEAAQARGYELCPAEAGLQLLRQYQDQLRGELLIMTMKPTSASGCDPGFFEVRHDAEGLWLYRHCGRSGTSWFPGYRFVFVRPRK